MNRCVALMMACAMLFAGLLGEYGHVRAHLVDDAAAWSKAMDAERAWLESDATDSGAVVFSGAGVHQHDHGTSPNEAGSDHNHSGPHSHGVYFVQASGLSILRDAHKVVRPLPRFSFMIFGAKDGPERPPRGLRVAI